MAPGSVIVDLAAERGGNCELTRAGEQIVAHGVTIIGLHQSGKHRPLSRQPDVRRRTSPHFSCTWSKNGKLQLNPEDEIVRDTLLTQGGEIVNARLREIYKLPALAAKS